MAHAVGLDFGGNLIRLCQVEYSSKGYKILHLRQHKRISSSPEHTKETLTLLFQGIPKDRVFVGISSENSIFRTLNVPFSDPEQIRKIVKFEAESHIHSCPIEKSSSTFTSSKKQYALKSSSQAF